MRDEKLKKKTVLLSGSALPSSSSDFEVVVSVKSVSGSGFGVSVVSDNSDSMIGISVSDSTEQNIEILKKSNFDFAKMTIKIIALN